MIVKAMDLAATVMVATLMTGCGGGGGGGTSPLSATYNFVTPAVASQRSYSRTIVDNSNNTINLSFNDTVTTVNPDGSYVLLQEDPADESVTLNGTTYAIVKETMNLNDSGQETSYSYTAANGRAVTCTFSPHGAGPDFPVTIGMSWTLEYTFACAADSPVTYRQMGSVADLEAVTVPAGTFSALKLQSTLSWTDLDGTTITQTVTNWRDVRTMFSVKEIVAIAYSGTIPANGRAVNTETVLESGPE